MTDSRHEPPAGRITESPNEPPADPGYPTVFVLFGATGDLAKRMVLPAFFQLAERGLMPEKWLLVGNGRGDVSHVDFRGIVHDALQEFGSAPEGPVWEEFADRLRFAGGGFEKNDPGSLLDVLEESRTYLGDDARFIHYLAVPPGAFMKLTEALGAHDLVNNARVIFEKPYGTSQESFHELDDAVHEVLDEEQVFRIDHFLGKEGTQNLHVMRFANGLFDSVWNRHHIRAVQIDVPETLDISDRAEFYDATGALRDMVVSHLFQIAAEVAMEPPRSLEPNDLQAARALVIDHFRGLAPEDVVFGQFEGYTDTHGIPGDSTTETFAAVRLWIDTERWKGVPFLLRSGKQLSRSAQKISLIFRQPEDGPLAEVTPQLGNVLTIGISGPGTISFGVVVKQPGRDLDLVTAAADLPLANVQEADPLPPYVKLIFDAIVGDRSLYTRPDGLEDAWNAAAPVLDHRPELHPYPRGSWGPDAAAALAAPDGWILGQ